MSMQILFHGISRPNQYFKNNDFHIPYFPNKLKNIFIDTNTFCVFILRTKLVNLDNQNIHDTSYYFILFHV